jgi:hypothetical protein
MDSIPHPKRLWLDKPNNDPMISFHLPVLTTQISWDEKSINLRRVSCDESADFHKDCPSAIASDGLTSSSSTALSQLLE